MAKITVTAVLVAGASKPLKTTTPLTVKEALSVPRKGMQITKRRARG